MGSSDSSSFISEPPDVRNWFSSYVYESPEMGSADGFKDSSFPALAGVGDGLKNGEEGFLEAASESKEEGLLADEKGLASDGFHTDNRANGDFETEDSLSQISEPPDIRNWFSSYVYESPSLDTCFESESHPVEDEVVEEENNAPKASMAEETRDKDSEPPIISFRTSPSDFDAEFQRISSERRQFIRPQKPSPQDHPTRGKENVRAEMSEDGFISTRKGKQREEENSIRKPGARVLEKGNKEDTCTRKALLEATNIQVPNVVEKTGKWKCPRKSKPDLGPPLKQLRLERWVRRV